MELKRIIRKLFICLIILNIFCSFCMFNTYAAIKDDEKKNYNVDQIVNYVEEEYGISEKTGSGAYGTGEYKYYMVNTKISESGDVLSAWKQAFAKIGYNGSSANTPREARTKRGAVAWALINNSEVNNNKEEEQEEEENFENQTQEEQNEDKKKFSEQEIIDYVNKNYGTSDADIKEDSEVLQKWKETLEEGRSRYLWDFTKRYCISKNCCKVKWK